MPEPIKAIFTDGVEVAMMRCPQCKHVRFVDYSCDSCKFIIMRDRLKTAQAMMHQLSDILLKIENDVQ